MNTHSHSSHNSLSLSVVIATFNEENYISACLESILDESKNFAPGHFEIIVADGGSTDKTVVLIEQFAAKYGCITLLRNPKRIQAAGWNLAIQKARGELISILGAHSHFPSHYLRDCADALHTYHADVVGGRTKAVAASHTLVNKTIAAVLCHVFGVGSSFRSIETGPSREVDTVFSGCYKKSIIERAGMFDERMICSQDIDLTMRIKKCGGKILLLPHLVVSYFPKKTLWTFAKHNWRDGIWAVYPRKFKPFRLKLRHLAPGIFVGGVIAGFALGAFIPFIATLTGLALGFYLVTALAMSVHLAVKNKSFGMIFTGPIVFAIRHLVYGAGTVFGFLQTL